MLSTNIKRAIIKDDLMFAGGKKDTKCQDIVPIVIISICATVITIAP